jgi:hypothetical protein
MSLLGDVELRTFKRNCFVLSWFLMDSNKALKGSVRNDLISCYAALCTWSRPAFLPMPMESHFRSVLLVHLEPNTRGRLGTPHLWRKLDYLVYPWEFHWTLSTVLSFNYNSALYVCPYLTGNILRLPYELKSLMLSIGLWRWYINITITILDIIHRPVPYLKLSSTL